MPEVKLVELPAEASSERAAKDRGDQFGLGLYAKDGSSKVGRSLAYEETGPPPITPPAEVGTAVAEIRDRMTGERDV